MKASRLLVWAVVVWLLIDGAAARAGSVLVYEGAVAGTSIVNGALALSGATTTVVTHDSTTFNAQLTGGSWSVVIYAEQGSATYEDSATQLASYLSGGGKLIGFTYRTNGLRELLGADYAASTNPYILDNDPTHPIFQTPYTLNTDGIPNNSYVGGHGQSTEFSHGWHPASGAAGLGNVNYGGYQAIVGNGDSSILNASLTDSYDTLSEGERLLANEIIFLAPTIAQSVPEPTSFIALSVAGLGLLKRRRR